MDKIIDRILSTSQGITPSEAAWLSSQGETAALLAAAQKVTASCAPSRFDTCSIINAKSGRCPEDCHWCAQSAHYKTGAAEYPLKSDEDIIQAALASQHHGIGRFSFVTSGRRLSDAEVDRLCRVAEKIRKVSSVSLCISAGLLSPEQLCRLFAARVVRYHCNLEAAPSYFPELCTTHSQNDKIATLRAARAAGMEMCSGGIIGMGETEQQRVELAFTLRELGVNSVPINVLSPIAGTPLQDMPPLSAQELLRCIALFRLILPKAYLRLAGGVARFDADTIKQAYKSGINAAIMGDMLTIAGTDISVNFSRIKSAGYSLD